MPLLFQYSAYQKEPLSWRVLYVRAVTIKAASLPNKVAAEKMLLEPSNEPRVISGEPLTRTRPQLLRLVFSPASLRDVA